RSLPQTSSAERAFPLVNRVTTGSDQSAAESEKSSGRGPRKRNRCVSILGTSYFRWTRVFIRLLATKKRNALDHQSPSTISLPRGANAGRRLAHFESKPLFQSETSSPSWHRTFGFSP